MVIYDEVRDWVEDLGMQRWLEIRRRTIERESRAAEQHAEADGGYGVGIGGFSSVDTKKDRGWRR